MKKRLAELHTFGPLGAPPQTAQAYFGASSSPVRVGAGTGSFSSGSVRSLAGGADIPEASAQPMFMWCDMWEQLADFAQAVLSARSNGSISEEDRVRSNGL